MSVLEPSDRHRYRTRFSDPWKRRGRKRPAVLEAIEPRILLASDGIPDAAVAKAIDNGLHAFGDMLSALSR